MCGVPDTADNQTLNTNTPPMGSACCPDARIEPVTPPEDGAEQKDYIDDLIENAVVIPPTATPKAETPQDTSVDDLEAALNRAVLGKDFTLKGGRYLAKVVSVYDG